MASGSTRHKSSLLGLILLPLLAGCFQYDPVSTVSWSPSGSRVAFLSGGRGWIYSLDDGSLSKLSDERFASLAWSPREDWIALSTFSHVTAFHEEAGVFTSSGVFPFEAGPEIPPLVMWHRSELKFLAGIAEGARVRTEEVDLTAGKSKELGAGIAVYGGAGPRGGEWFLWTAPAAVGLKTEKLIFDRQTRAGESLPLSREMVAALEEGADTLFSSFIENSPLPLCVQRDDPEGISRVVCLDGRGRLDVRASLPSGGRVFAAPDRNLFAVMTEKGSEPPLLEITDGLGKVRADGAAFLERIDEVVGLDHPDKTSFKVSRLAFSPDGSWLAWVVKGRLCLWDWRNDEVRIHYPVSRP